MTRAEAAVYRAARSGARGWTRIVIGLLALVLLLPMGVTIQTVWGAATLQYTLTTSHLEIPYGLKTTRIMRDEITEVSVIHPTGGKRLIGTSMRGLQHGRWAFLETGIIFMFSTSTRPLTVLQTPFGKYGISPKDPDGFSEALRSGETGTWETTAAASAQPEWIILFVLGTLLPLGVALLLIYMLRVPHSITYTLGREALEIHCGWSQIRIPYSQIQSVEGVERPGRMLKTFGADMPGLHWGRFWRKGGGSIHLYATQLHPVVLIRSAGLTCGITPADPERFLSELRDRLGGM